MEATNHFTECPECGDCFDVKYMCYDMYDSEYWDAVDAGVIHPNSDDTVTAYWAVCDNCGVTDVYYSYMDAVQAAKEGKFTPWDDTCF